MRSSSTRSPRRAAARARSRWALHVALEALEIDAEPLLARDLRGQLDRKAVRVVQVEDVARVQGRLALLACHAHEIVEQARAGLQRPGEALLLGLEQAPDVVAVPGELGEAVGQRLDHGLVHGSQERRLETEARAVQDGAPDDPAQHVAAALVGGRHAVGRDRAHAARVVAEHAERAHGIAAIGVATAREPLQRLDHVRRLVGLEEAAGALQEHGDSLDAAARVDVLRRKRRERAVVAAIELHEDEIPVLEEAIAVAARLAVGAAAAELRAAVVVELRARAAGPRRPRLPEVVLAERDDATRRGCPARARDRARRRRARAGRRPRRPSPRCARGRVPKRPSRARRPSPPRPA